jgi:hypothetical protein
MMADEFGVNRDDLSNLSGRLGQEKGRFPVCVICPIPLTYPHDYFLFPKLKLPLKGDLFEDIQDIQGAVTLSLRAIPLKLYVLLIFFHLILMILHTQHGHER